MQLPLTFTFLLLNLSTTALTAPTTSTQQTCSTKLGKKSVQPIPTSTKTTAKAVKTYTEKSVVTPIITVTPKPKTTTAFSTITSSFTTTALGNTQTSTTTITEFTTVGSTVTETFTNTIVTTTTETSTADTVTVPTPAGFTPVQQANGYVPKIKGRDVLPRAATPSLDVVRYSVAKGANPHVATPTRYPNSVICKQVLQPVTTTTITVTASKTRTTKLAPVTQTQTITKAASTIVTSYPPDVTATETTITTSTVSISGTTTVTVDETATATETVIAPAPTYYAACSDANLVETADGGYTISGVGISGSNYYTDANNAYECCAACQASNCKVAIYFAAAYPSGVCFNSYQQDNTCTPQQGTDYFYPYSDQRYPYTISNGVCGQFVNGGNYPDYY